MATAFGPSSGLIARLPLLVMGLALSLAPMARASAQSPPAHAPAHCEPAGLPPLELLTDDAPHPRLLNVRSDGSQLRLPLAELGRLLRLDLRIDAARGWASVAAQGDRPAVELNLAEGSERIAGRQWAFESRQACVTADEIFVSSQTLARWLQVDLQFDAGLRQLRIKPLAAPAGQSAVSVGRSDGEPSTAVPASARDHDANLLMLELQLDGHVLSDSLNAYQDGRQILLPLGELTRLLTLAITVRPEQGSASGFVVREDKVFSLNLAQAVVSVNGRDQHFEARLAKVIGDEIYVSSQLLARWLPIDLELVISRLQLRVKPRQPLPLQDKLARESAAARLGERRKDGPAFRRHSTPYQWAGMPFVDQTFGSQLRRGGGASEQGASYRAYVTGDLLGMEGAAYLALQQQKSTPELRLTLGRRDPDAGLLGPLRARSVEFGSINVQSIPNLMLGGPAGNGVSVSNRRLNQPTSFDLHSLRGDLPPGWDVNLYYNDALVAYQQSRADGRYAFEDLPLAFGVNDFRLVFNGPLGQVRVERQRYLLDQSVVKPGEMLYSLVQHSASNGDLRSVAQFDIGLTRAIAANAGLFRGPRLGKGRPQAYSQIGFRGYWDAMVLSAQFTGARTGGSLVDLNLKTRLGGFALDLQRLHLHNGFESDLFAPGPQALRTRDRLRINGAIRILGFPPLNTTLETVHETLRSGARNRLALGRLSGAVGATSVSNQISWQNLGGDSSVEGVAQLSRQMLGLGVNAQLNYMVRPTAALQSLTLTASRNLDAAYRVNAAVTSSMSSKITVWSAGLNKNLGSFGLAINGSRSNRGELTLGLQLFMSLGRDPRSGKWMADAQPQAGTGAVSARVFVDRNLNGTRDADEETVSNAGFMIGAGGRHPNRTDAAGTAFIGRLPPGQFADIALDPGTLEDPQWRPATAGVRVLPRPGQVQLIEFPVVSSTEIDGTVYLVTTKGRRGIGDARIELVDERGVVAAATVSSGDGYYLLPQVIPGNYTLRIAPEQAAKLGLVGSLSRALKVGADGDFINGQDFELQQQAR